MEIFRKLEDTYVQEFKKNLLNNCWIKWITEKFAKFLKTSNSEILHLTNRERQNYAQRNIGIKVTNQTKQTKKG